MTVPPWVPSTKGSSTELVPISLTPSKRIFTVLMRSRPPAYLARRRSRRATTPGSCSGQRDHHAAVVAQRQAAGAIELGHRREDALVGLAVARIEDRYDALRDEVAQERLQLALLYGRAGLDFAQERPQRVLLDPACRLTARIAHEEGQAGDGVFGVTAHAHEGESLRVQPLAVPRVIEENHRPVWDHFVEKGFTGPLDAEGGDGPVAADQKLGFGVQAGLAPHLGGEGGGVERVRQEEEVLRAAHQARVGVGVDEAGHDEAAPERVALRRGAHECSSAGVVADVHDPSALDRDGLSPRTGGVDGVDPAAW